jgi:hypothetical protein
MKTTLLFGLFAGFASICAAEQILTQYDWRQVAEAGQLSQGAVVTVDGRSAVEISNTNATPLRVRVLTIQKPPVNKTFYAILGEVKYERVRGDGYLEMWNYFPPLRPGVPEGAFFSRTLGDSGEMAKLTGTSNWRRFMLPFDRTGASGPPTRLEVSVFLPGQGTVFLGPIRLVEYTGTLSEALRPAGAWWSDRMAGLIGGIAGATIGCLASLLAWLATRGKARTFVVVTSSALIGLGLLSALAGVIALSFKQPYAVWFPLLLLGILLLAILPGRLRQFQKLYEQIELRKMAAMDALGG